MRILFTPITSSSIAHIVRSLAIADILKQRGHEIYFTSCQNKKDFIEKQGYKVVSTYPSVNMNDPYDQSINYIKDHKSDFINWFRSEIEATKIIKPDLVIQAPALFGPYVYYSTHTPVVSIIDSQYLPESKGIMGLSLSSDSLKHVILRSILRPIFNKKFIELYLKEILYIYEALNINETIRSRDELYKPMKVIIPSDEIMEPLKKVRECTDYVGPIFWDGFENMTTDLTERNLIEFKNNHKLAYLTFGASIFNIDIYKKILYSFLQNGFKTIVCLGPNFKRDEFPSDNENIKIRNFVPGLRVSKIADIIINTGSQGAIMQGLISGKPQVAFPTTIDQAFYSNRIEELGLGINANKINILNFSKRESYTDISKDVPNRVIQSAYKIINNPQYHKNCVEFSKSLKKYRDPALMAANIIENYSKNI